MGRLALQKILVKTVILDFLYQDAWFGCVAHAATMGFFSKLFILQSSFFLVLSFVQDELPERPIGSRFSQRRRSSHIYESPYTMGYGYPGMYGQYGAQQTEKTDGAGFLQRLLRRDTTKTSIKRRSRSEGYYSYDEPTAAARESSRRKNSSSASLTYESTDDHGHTPGSTIHALAVASSVVALSVVATVPRSKRFSPEEATTATGRQKHGQLGEPVSLDDVRDPVKRMEMEKEAAGQCKVQRSS